MGCTSFNKHKLLIMCAIASAVIIVIVTTKLTANSIQRSYYKANEVRLREEWSFYEQPKESIKISIKGIETRDMIVFHSTVISILYGVVTIILIWLAETAEIKNKMNNGPSWAIELVLAIHLGFVSFRCNDIIINGVIAWIVLSLGIAVTVGCLVYLFLYRGLSHGEVIVYGFLLVNIISIIVFHFFSDDVRLMDGIILLEEYNEIDEILKSKIMKLCFENGIKRNHVFINHSLSINACAISNYRTKSLIINKGSVEKLPEDLLCAQTLHEVGHLINNHVGIFIMFLLFSQFTFLLAVVFIFRITRKHYNKPAIIYLLFFILLLVKNILSYVENVYVRWPLEYNADLYALKKGYREETELLLQMYSRRDNGLYFDYIPFFGGLYFTHPPFYRRACKCKEYQAE
ncbi:hypothetical protein PAEPH01_0386 [Pancytospora epiphaga]|nr:hypothetical protein PAEPH01_0386 [Pancytospora epiphaga]